MSVLQFKKANCKNCYKCVRNCPVKAIKIEDHQAQIILDECILCGNCITVCPQNAKEVRSDVAVVKEMLKGGEVYASVAPSFIASYPVKSLEEFSRALLHLGFSGAFETATGAFLTKTQYEKELSQNPQGILISTCCPTVVSLVQKYYPKAVPYLSPTLSPMQAHAKFIKNERPNAKVVFLGPCISKKEECAEISGLCDAVLTFEELNGWFDEQQIVFNNNNVAESNGYRSRFFPVSGGIIKSMNCRADVSYIAVDGLSNCMYALEEICAGRLSNCFIEMSACEGSCVGGHATGNNAPHKIRARMQVEKLAFSPNGADFDVDNVLELNREIFIDRTMKQTPPPEVEITKILKKMGKYAKSDELNCGTCGYSTCREKAAAVYFGKADITMCLPYMKERAESFSDQIISVTPNAILTVDGELVVQQINSAACSLFQIASSDVIGKSVSCIMEEFDFAAIIAEESVPKMQNVFLERYNKYMEQTFVYDKGSAMVICIMKDITDEKRRHEQIMKQKEDTAKMADQIVEKQLRVVHEIASLLGETAAETKVALTKLKDTIILEEEIHE